VVCNNLVAQRRTLNLIPPKTNGASQQMSRHGFVELTGTCFGALAKEALDGGRFDGIANGG